MSMNMSLKQASELELARFAREGVDVDLLMDDEDGKRAVLNLDKSWHTLHYLFTGRSGAAPLPGGALLGGGREVGEDLGYGPARTLSAKETKAFADFLATQTGKVLAGRIDMATMQRLGIYCAEDADDASRAELTDDVDHYFPQLQAYVGEAAEHGRGLLIWMS